MYYLYFRFTENTKTKNRNMKSKVKNNWHVIEEGQIRSSWNSYEVAKEFYDRLCRCFPDVCFEMLQLDSLNDSGLRDETGEFL